MWPFRRSREGSSVLDQRSPETTAQYLCRLMAENNALHRELIQALTGRPAKTLTVGEPLPANHRVRTDRDVFRVDRDTVLKDQFVKMEKDIAPWRTAENGPASSLPLPSHGTAAPASSRPVATSPILNP